MTSDAALGPSTDSQPAVETGRRRRWPAVLAVIIAILAAYSAVAVIGVREEAREARVLGSFTPVFEFLRDNGAALQLILQKDRLDVGFVATGLLLLLGIAAFVRNGRRAAPVGLLVLALGLAAWAQVSLQSNAHTLGAALYLAAGACALALGVWVPFSRLTTFPPFPRAATAANHGVQTRPAARDWFTLSWGRECGLVLVLTLIALVSRTWALTELYDFFDLETIDWMVQGRTWHGFLGYLDYGFVQNNGGAVQFLPTQVIFRLFGTSIFTLRMAAVLWSIAAIPLMYTLGRRLGGVVAGVIASVLLITAPEQLFWARNENLHFAPMAVCALVTAHLALWMVQRFSLASVVVNALWMPWCRWFYSACMVAFLIPIATALHAIVFARGLWRKAWYVIPLIGAGLVFWIFSLTVMKAALHDWHWQFVDPSAVYGASAWRKQGEFVNASWPDLLRLQAVSMTTNLTQVLGNMSDQTENFSHWCQRSQPGDHRTILNVGLTLVVFVGIGYLLGQFYDRRAFLLLAWWGIAILPAILSQDPADRRMAMVFPASHALAATVIAAFLHLVAERGGRMAEWLATVIAAVGLAVIALTNLSSHLLLPINPILFSDYPRFTKPMLEDSDATFTNLPGPFRTFSVFGNLDHFLAKPTCLQYVEPQHWLATALNPQCAFDDPVYGLTVGADAIEGLRKAYNPKRVSYLLTEDPPSAPQIALLRALHPTATLLRHEVPRGERALVAMTVDADEIATLREPSLSNASGTATILAGVRLQPAPAPSGTAAPAGPTVAGGILVESEGWYRWRLDPPCADASLVLDGQPVTGDAQAMLSGVHPFTLTLPSASTCKLPLRIIMDGVVPRRQQAVPPEHYTSPTVAALPQARAPEVETFAGYEKPVPVVQFAGRPVDFGVDAQGNFSVLLKEGGDVYRIRRYDRTGKEFAAWQVPLPPTINPATIAVAADGTTAVLVQRTIHLYDAHGTPIGEWEHPWFVWESHLAFWGDLLVSNIHHRDSMAVFTRKGDLVTEFKTFAGGPGKLYAPMAFALSADGDLLIQQLDGKALRFHLDGTDFAPRFVEEFRVDSSAPGSGFDGPERALVPSESGLRVFGRDGNRLMAADPTRDPSQFQFSNALQIRRADGRLYVLDSDRNTLWTIPG